MVPNATLSGVECHKFIRCEAPSSLHPGFRILGSRFPALHLFLRSCPLPLASWLLAHFHARIVHFPGDCLDRRKACAEEADGSCAEEAPTWGIRTVIIDTECRQFANPPCLLEHEVHEWLHFREIDPAQAGRCGEIEPIQTFCPRLFWSTSMPASYRSVSAGNSWELGAKFGSARSGELRARSDQFISPNGFSTTIAILPAIGERLQR
jgi:hypothetical protein